MFEQIAAVAGPFLLGLIVGALIKRVLTFALLIMALFVVLVAFGYATPQQVASILQQLGYAAKDALDYAMKFRDVVPYSSLAFLVGLAIGLWRG